MPLTATFSWRETPSEVVLDVPLRGCSPDSLDVTVSDVVVKLSFVPYLLVIDLLQEILPADARLVLDRSSNMVTVHLRKAVVGPWGKLSLEADAQTLVDRREASLEREYERQRQLSLARSNAAGVQEREATRQQMAVEERARQVLTQRQQEEKEAAQAEAVATLKAISRESEAPKKTQVAESVSSTSAIFPARSEGSSEPRQAQAQVTTQQTHRRKNILEQEKDDEAPNSKHLVPPRAGQSVSIKFTPRSFPTPLRESRAKEEEDWLAKNYLKLKTGPQGPDRPFVERDPAWLKDKGNSFAQAGDWPSADAAYTAALEGQPQDVGLLLNRALARVQQDKADAAVQDCSAAIASILGLPYGADFDLDRCIQLQSSKIQALPDKARGQVLKALGRVVLCRIRAGTYTMAKQALGLLASVDVSFEVASEGCVEALEGLAQAEAHKIAADGRMRAGDQAGAVQRYEEALQLQPQYVQALMNKSAALHALCRWTECEGACSYASQLLAASPAWSTATLEPHFLQPIPCTGTALHSQCKTRAETRIADCRAKLQKTSAS